MTKRCSKCGRDKPPDAFHRDRSRKSGRTSQCRACVAKSVRRRKDTDPELDQRIRALRRRWNKENPDRVKDSYARRRYGVAGAEYDARYAEFLLRQGGMCAICGRVDRVSPLHLDHDHKTGYFRGLLCKKCNTAIGLMGDDRARLAQAIIYLQIAQEEQEQQAQQTAAVGQANMNMGGF